MTMQAGGAYVDQIPADVKPPPAIVAPAAKVPGATPPGLYLQVASVETQAEAVQAGLELSSRLGSKRPPVIRGAFASVEGVRRIRLYAGPFVDPKAAEAFCSLALPQGSSCLLVIFKADGGIVPSK